MHLPLVDIYSTNLLSSRDKEKTLQYRTNQVPNAAHTIGTIVLIA